MDFNFMSPTVLENPYPYYAQLRHDAPVYWIEPMQAWAISRYDEVFFVLRNPQLFSSARWWQATSAQDMDPALEAPHIMASDPPVHTRLRKLINRAFTPRLVAELEPRIRTITNDLFDQMAAREQLDFMRDLAIPLPVTVIAELLGIEKERQDDFRRWTDSFVATVGGMGTETMNAQARQDLAEFHAYFRQMIEKRHKEPKGDLISGMVRAQEEGQMLTSGEVFNLATFLLLAGNETTANLIGNTILAMLQHPQETAKVRANPALLPNLVEEGLRYDSPIQIIPRHAVKDVEIGGKMIPAGAAVLVMLASANRDERIFSEPNRFDVTRDNAKEHLAFGFGIHFCLGAQLARLEGQAALETLLARYPRLSLREDGLERDVSAFIPRGLRKLPARNGHA